MEWSKLLQKAENVVEEVLGNFSRWRESSIFGRMSRAQMLNPMDLILQFRLLYLLEQTLTLPVSKSWNSLEPVLLKAGSPATYSWTLTQQRHPPKKSRSREKGKKINRRGTLARWKKEESDSFLEEKAFDWMNPKSLKISISHLIALCIMLIRSRFQFRSDIENWLDNHHNEFKIWLVSNFFRSCTMIIEKQKISVFLKPKCTMIRRYSLKEKKKNLLCLTKKSAFPVLESTYWFSKLLPRNLKNFLLKSPLIEFLSLPL